MKNFSLNFKFLFVVAILSVGAIVISWRGIVTVAAVENQLEYIAIESANRSQKWNDMIFGYANFRVIIRDLFLEPDPVKREVIDRKIEEMHTALHKTLDELALVSKDEVGKAKVTQFDTAFDSYWAVVESARKYAREDKLSEGLKVLQVEGRVLAEELVAVADYMLDVNKKSREEQVQMARASYESGLIWMIGTSVFSIVLGWFLGVWVLRQVNRSIAHVIEMLQLNSTQVGTAATQIASSSSNLSQAATEQAASLEETAASLEELTSMVQRNTENSKRASEVSGVSQASAERGKLVVDEMSKAITEIDGSNQAIMTQVEESNRQISEITKVIAEIGNKTKVINDIVFQTKLLSFNASVEAARAGEHGKGFAVVAEEVGNLAAMSGNAAKEISEMLDASIFKVDMIVRDTKTKVEVLIHEGKAKVEVGTRIAAECGTVLEEIVRSVSEVTQMSNDIANASREQAQGVGEINKAMNQMDTVTQSNASSSEQTASSAQALASQARDLRDTVSELVGVVHGAKTTQEDLAARSSGHSPSYSSTVSGAPKANSKSKPESKTVSKSASKSESKVVAIKSSKKAQEKTTKTSVAAAPEHSIPLENDPRFKDI